MKKVTAVVALGALSLLPILPWRRAASEEPASTRSAPPAHRHGPGEEDSHSASEKPAPKKPARPAHRHGPNEKEEGGAHEDSKKSEPAEKEASSGSDGEEGEEASGGQNAEEGEGEEGHEHGEPETVSLNPQALIQAGVVVAPAEKGRISHEISLTGTVSANEEQTVHLSPKVEGVISKVLKGLGERVEAGEPVVILDSTQLGTAKVEFMRLLQEFETARIELDRKRVIRENTQKLMKLLRQEMPPLEAEAKTQDLALGENRAKLLTSYAVFQLSKSSYSRQERLYKRKVTSQKEFLDSKKELETAQVEYRGAIDQVSYAIETEFLAAEREFRTKEAAYLAASQQLEMLGTTTEELNDLREGRSLRLNIFTVRSPIAGTMIEKHGSLGERVSPETTLATVADLSALWVIGDVYEKDLAHVHPGMPAVIEVASYPDHPFPGVVSMVSRVVDPSTRTSRVRIVVENPQNILSIGMFANVKTTTGTEESVLSVPIAAVQEIEGHPTVFVKETEDRFRAQPVVTGSRDEKQKRIEVYSGIQEKDPVVIKGAFFLRSELAKGEMGHDHAH